MSLQRLSFGFILIALVAGFVQANTLLDDAAVFPNDFAWGVASAAYQVEGAWNVSGKNDSIWDVFANTPGVINNNDTGNDATKFYELYGDDIRMMEDLGIKHFRFSLSWSRILPNGTADQPNQEGIDFYNSVLNALNTSGIEPWVTLYHWDLPAALNDNTTTGGWLNSNISNVFQEYADFCFKTFGSKVKRWLTVNEISSFAWIGYGNGLHAPGRCSKDVIPECNPVGGVGNSSTEPYTVAHNAIIAHAKAVQTYNEKYREEQNGTIGFTFNAGWALPYNPNNANDSIAVENNLIFNYAWYTDPIFFGDYPEEMKTLIGDDRLPQFTPEEKVLLKNITVDFLGLNHYTSRFVEYTGVPGNSWITDGQYKEHTTDVFGNSIGAQSAADWLYVYPTGFRRLLNWIDRRYTQNSVRPNIYVFENGVSAPEELNATTPVLNDTFRVSYLQNYIANMARAIIRDGVQVKGYFSWSITDNFEWAYGYQVRFGLVHVDFTDNARPRTLKASANWYHDAITNITGGQNLTTVLHLLGLNQTTVAIEDTQNSFLSK